MKKRFVFLLHFGYWLIYLLLLLVFFAILTTQIRKTPGLFSQSFLLPFILFCFAPNFLAFYSAYFFLFQNFLRRKKFLALLFYGALICLTAAMTGNSVALFLMGFDQRIFTDAREFSTITASFFLVAAIHAGAALVIRGFITWYAEIKLKEELYKKNFEMELALIKSQINPHFLFNTINNIDVLISKDAAQASQYLNKLSDILRYMVYEAKTEKISLAGEIDYIGKYLELQKIRTTNPDYVNFQISGESANRQIAPLILFPFIENAFKHTENKKKSSTIEISISIETGKIIFECKNSYQPNKDKKQDFGGAGNDLVKKRLMLMYPEKHSLLIADDGAIYGVNLTLYEN